MSKRSNRSAAEDLRRTVSDALTLIEQQAGAQARLAAPSLPAGALLDQCRALVERASARRPEPVRTLHHMACTGGTLISKFISALPNTVLLSEVDPLSTLHLRKSPKKPFFPSDLIADLRYSPREIPLTTDMAVFRAGVAALRSDLERYGRRLVLRDHTHSRYHATPDPHARPGLRDIVRGGGDLLSVVTVRHPLDSFLSLQNNGWVHFEPGTLDEYCGRYRLFLADHDDVAIFKYESFVDSPELTLRQIAADLELGWADEVADLHAVFRISGDSGRKTFQVGRRKRREASSEVLAEVERSEHYAALCAQLGYHPDPDGDEE